nr:hypothetical protein [Tanacetum cinerariifolium]
SDQDISTCEDITKIKLKWKVTLDGRHGFFWKVGTQIPMEGKTLSVKRVLVQRRRIHGN